MIYYMFWKTMISGLTWWRMVLNSTKTASYNVSRDKRSRRSDDDDVVG